MSFCGDTIIFNGISSEEFGLMLVGEIDGNEQECGLLGSKVTIIEDTLLRRPSPIYYASEQNKPIEFKLVLSVMRDNTSLTRYDLAAIAGWLYGYHDYKKLIICQDDMADYFYRCKVVELEPIFIAGKTVGVIVSFRCDSPFAYMRTTNDVVVSPGVANYVYYNRSNMNEYFYPKITISATGETSEIKILNSTTGDSACIFSDIPTTGATITMDCMRQILTSNEMADVYSHCNFNFPAFIKGSNQLQLTGNFMMTIVNEFPMYIGA